MSNRCTPCAYGVVAEFNLGAPWWRFAFGFLSFRRRLHLRAGLRRS